MDVKLEAKFEATMSAKDEIIFYGPQRERAKTTTVSAEKVREQAIAMVDEVLRRTLPGQSLVIVVTAYD